MKSNASKDYVIVCQKVVAYLTKLGKGAEVTVPEIKLALEIEEDGSKRTSRVSSLMRELAVQHAVERQNDHTLTLINGVAVYKVMSIRLMKLYLCQGPRSAKERNLALHRSQRRDFGHGLSSSGAA